MNRFLFIIFACSFLIISCTTPEEEAYHQTPVKVDSILKKQPVVIVDSTYDSALVKFPAVTTALKRWFDFYRKKYPDFDIAAFKLDRASTNSFTSRSEEMSKKNLELYKNLFIYSPDRSSLIDMDTYNFFLSKDKNGNLIGEGGDPETEVALVDLKAQTRTQLFYAGPLTGFDDAAWLNQFQLAIVSLDGNGKQHTFVPCITVIDFANNTTIGYRYIKKINVDPGDYQSQVRLKGIKIR
ncbi:MAG: hypothetical protein JWP12_766 [Bacteroidetes bacterium]|nr:hypothetical protein [Bacteroidota bacterium]